MKRTPYTGAKIITADKAHELIKEKGNRWFWAAFIRKTDKKVDGKYIARKGNIRYMCCRTGVKKGLKTANGEGRRYNYTEKRLTSVWDRQKGAYRAFGWDNLVYLKIGGKKYVVLTETARQFCLRNKTHEMAKALKANKVLV